MSERDEELELVRQNERYKAALQHILTLCQQSVFGAWRFRVGEIAANALGLTVKR